MDEKQVPKEISVGVESHCEGVVVSTSEWMCRERHPDFLQ